MRLPFSGHRSSARVKPTPRRRPVRRSVLALTALASALALAPSTAAQADPGVVYFHSGNTDCALHDNGSFTCGLASSVNPPLATLEVAGMKIPVPFSVSKVSYGGQGIPTLPSFAAADEYTLPDGNPDIADVATGRGQWGSIVEHGGTKCESGFHGSFTCTSGAHGFTTWSGYLTMS